MKSDDFQDLRPIESAGQNSDQPAAIGGGYKSQKQKNNQLSFLHVLRFILAVSVVLWHYHFGVSLDPQAHPLLYGIRVMTIYGGNQAFLLISGMMFYLAYYRKLTTDKLSVTDFLKKRAVRIYPTVIISVLVSYLLAVIIHFSYNAAENINLIDLLKDMFFFGGRLFGGSYGIYNGPIWFLAPLGVSYLISALIIVLTKKKRSVYWFLIPLAITFFAALGSNFIVPVFNVNAISSELFNFFLGFFFMIFLKKFENWSGWLKISLRILGLVVAILFLYAFYKTNANSPLGSGEMIGSLFCWIPLITCLYGLKINFIFDNFVFKTIGGLSFHIYVWHAVVYKAWDVFFTIRQQPVYGNSLQALLIFLLLVLTVSAVSYTISELIRKFKVFEKIKEKIIKVNHPVSD